MNRVDGARYQELMESMSRRSEAAVLLSAMTGGSPVVCDPGSEVGFDVRTIMFFDPIFRRHQPIQWCFCQGEVHVYGDDFYPGNLSRFETAVKAFLNAYSF